MTMVFAAGVALAAFLAEGASAGPPPAGPAVPFERRHACEWMMKDPGEQLIRGSIEQGDKDPILFIVDSTFNSWSDTEDHAVELRVNGSGKSARTRAYATRGGETPTILGIYLDRRARRLVGGAERLQLWKGGKPVLNLAFAGTPSARELDSCVRPPGWDKGGDSE